MIDVPDEQGSGQQDIEMLDVLEEVVILDELDPRWIESELQTAPVGRSWKASDSFSVVSSIKLKLPRNHARRSFGSCKGIAGGKGPVPGSQREAQGFLT